MYPRFGIYFSWRLHVNKIGIQVSVFYVGHCKGFNSLGYKFHSFALNAKSSTVPKLAAKVSVQIIEIWLRRSYYKFLYWKISSNLFWSYNLPSLKTWAICPNIFFKYFYWIISLKWLTKEWFIDKIYGSQSSFTDLIYLLFCDCDMADPLINLESFLFLYFTTSLRAYYFWFVLLQICIKCLSKLIFVFFFIHSTFSIWDIVKFVEKHSKYLLAILWILFTAKVPSRQLHIQS